MKPTDVDSGVTAEMLRSVLKYNRVTGIFTWRVKRRVSEIGDVAGRVRKDGYMDVFIFGRMFLLHRLAWLYVKGEWPLAEVDHRDLNKMNMRWRNLRPASRAQNNSNVNARNKIGLKGVFFKEAMKARPYQSVIRLNGATRHLGFYATAQEAHEAYVAAAKRERGEFARAA